MVKIANTDWNGWLDEDMHFATNMLLDKGSVQPMYILHTRDGELMVIAAGFASDHEKRASQIYVKAMCMAYDVIAFSFIGEAWIRMMSRQPGESVEQMNARARSVRPAAAADRKEIVTVTLVYRQETAGVGKRSVIGKMAEIVRDDAGKAVRVIPMLMPTGTTSSGDIPEILSEKIPSASHRATAKSMLRSLADVLDLKD